VRDCQRPIKRPDGEVFHNKLVSIERPLSRNIRDCNQHLQFQILAARMRDRQSGLGIRESSRRDSRCQFPCLFMSSSHSAHGHWKGVHETEKRGQRAESRLGWLAHKVGKGAGPPRATQRAMTCTGKRLISCEMYILLNLPNDMNQSAYRPEISFMS